MLDELDELDDDEDSILGCAGCCCSCGNSPISGYVVHVYRILHLIPCKVTWMSVWDYLGIGYVYYRKLVLWPL